MDTYLITSENVALLFRRGERFDPYLAVEDCLRRSGLPVWKRVEAEAFDSPEGTLLLARPAGPKRERTGSGLPRLSRRRSS